MKVKYFADTDTLLIELRADPIVETRDLDENTLLDLDRAGNISPLRRLNMQKSAPGIPIFSYEQIIAPTRVTGPGRFGQFCPCSCSVVYGRINRLVLTRPAPVAPERGFSFGRALLNHGWTRIIPKGLKRKEFIRVYPCLSRGYPGCLSVVIRG